MGREIKTAFFDFLEDKNALKVKTEDLNFEDKDLVLHVPTGRQMRDKGVDGFV